MCGGVNETVRNAMPYFSPGSGFLCQFSRWFFVDHNLLKSPLSSVGVIGAIKSMDSLDCTRAIIRRNWLVVAAVAFGFSSFGRS